MDNPKVPINEINPSLFESTAMLLDHLRNNDFLDELDHNSQQSLVPSQPITVHSVENVMVSSGNSGTADLSGRAHL